jgi:Zn-dependent protease
MTLAAPAGATTCAGCGTHVSASLLSCPSCHRLVHADTLKDLAARAEAAAAAGETQQALESWRASLDLLPAGAKQSAAVSRKIAALSSTLESSSATPTPVPSSGAWRWLAALGPVGILVWKFKFLIVAVLSKGKLLLFGLTKIGTLASMFATVGVYWTAWGLWFALGLVISIYVHEMGHVAALRRYGIAATAPMFIPGFGAFIRLQQSPVTTREDARIGLAGPVWGLGAAVAALMAGVLGGGKMFLAIAHTGAWINLFNLMPIWQLDGSRAFASLTRAHRWIAVAALGVAYAMTGDGIVLLVLLVAVGRALTGGAARETDHGALALYVFVALALAVVFRLTPAAFDRS